MRSLPKTLVCLLLVLAGPLMAKEEPKAQVKLLTIGNSFANDATAYLPAMAKAAGKDLLLFRANLGGCTFERHARHMKAFELDPADPQGSPYRGSVIHSLADDVSAPKIASGGNEVDPKSKEVPKNFSLRQALELEKWDYVTIQQVSNTSFQFETFEPYAGELIAYIRKYAPTAEIVIHQTWAYREDCPLYKDGFDQQKMFDGLVAAYGQLAEKYSLRTVPVGTAMQEARKLPRWSFKYPDPAFNYKEPLPGTSPVQPGSLNVGWTVKKTMVAVEEPAPVGEPAPAGQPAPAAEPATGGTTIVKAEPKKVEKLVASLDFKHCNAEGRYLGASVFYGFLFGGKVAENTFVPPVVKPEDAAVLRGIADQVLVNVPAPALK
ncbi:DUF4886 domain-containing protein [Luteolibacter sp. SL250]|uniref:DUF4886 domain-containing protein n=1 Tax=Luteolibacter sp. SL250 TaxID=2995170 RepID=UPI00226DA6A6|nr:DUF4886 domain-containing protein [Luteolibacter sp. SL250]WAC21154.1 DUF4886 domain-containing protein [Luteolibacter sp. SL250]